MSKKSLLLRWLSRSSLRVSMLAAWILSSRCEPAGRSASKYPLPSNSLNEPRTLVTMAWRATKPMRLCVGSIA